MTTPMSAHRNQPVPSGMTKAIASNQRPAVTKTNDHILIIDDDPILTEVLRAHFARLGGANCITAKNGAEAAAYLDQLGEQIKFITCDLNMPECDGIEFFSELKKRSSETPVLIVTSAIEVVSKSAQKIADAYGLNCLGVIRKPVRVDELERILERARL